MKTMRWILLSVVVLGVVGWILAQAEGSKRADADIELQTLRQQVEQLQARLKVLEDRLLAVESPKPGSPPRILMQPKPPAGPPTSPTPSPPGSLGISLSQPKVWGQREINGWTYYFIPCGEK